MLIARVRLNRYSAAARGARGRSGKRARGMKNLTDLSADYMSGQIDRADMERGNGRPEVRKSLFRRLYRIIYGRCRGESNDIMTVFYTLHILAFIRIYTVWVCGCAPVYKRTRRPLVLAGDNCSYVVDKTCPGF